MRIGVRKYLLVWVFAALACAAGALIAVNRAHAETIGFSLSPDSESRVVVLDDVTGAPLDGANVSIEGGEGAARTITVSREGYVTLTLVGVRSERVTVYLKPRTAGAREVVARGVFGGFDEPPAMDYVQAGVVFKSLSALDLLDFRVDSFVSPLRDRIDVFGPREVRSNLVLPEQHVVLPFGSITLDKPGYRIPLLADRKVRLAGAQGHVKVRELLPIFQGGGKITADILNKLQFTKVGLTGDLMPRADFEEDFDGVVGLVPGRHQVTVDRPPFPADVMVAAATDLSGDRTTLLPTDVKTAISSANPGQVRGVSLSAPQQNLGQSRGVISFAVGGEGRRISGIVTDQAGRVVRPGPFLAVDELPDFARLPESIRVRAPAQGVASVTFSDADSAAWTVFVLPAAGDARVPTDQLPPRLRVTKYSVSQFDFGSSFDERAIDGAGIMRRLERFTRATARASALD